MSCDQCNNGITAKQFLAALYSKISNWRNAVNNIKYLDKNGCENRWKKSLDDYDSSGYVIEKNFIIVCPECFSNQYIFYEVPEIKCVECGHKQSLISGYI